MRGFHLPSSSAPAFGSGSAAVAIAPAPAPAAAVYRDTVHITAPSFQSPQPDSAAAEVPLHQLDAQLHAGLDEIAGAEFDEHGLLVERAPRPPTGGIQIDGEEATADESDEESGPRRRRRGGGGGGGDARDLEAAAGEIASLQRQVVLFKQKITQGETRLARLRQRSEVAEQETKAMQDKVADMEANWTPKVTLVVKDEGELARKRADARRRMLAGGFADDEEENEAEEAVGLSRGLGLANQKAFKRAMAFIAHRLPLQDDVSKVQARYGESVSAYFAFERWIIITYVLLACIVSISLIQHIVTLAQTSGASSYLQFQSFLPRFLLLSSFQRSERVAATSVLVACNAVLLLACLRKWVAEDRLAREMAVYAANEQFSDARLVLNVWDFAQGAPEEVLDQQMALGQQIVTRVFEEKQNALRQARSQRERAQLVLRRVVANFVYGTAQLAGWATILYLSSQSTALESSFSKSIAASIVPASVSIINAGMPVVVKTMTHFEKRDSGAEVMRIMVRRLFVAKTLNVVIQLLAFALLADPYLLTKSGPEYRTAVAKDYSTAYECRSEQAGVGLTQLVITEFVVGKVLAVAIPLTTKKVHALLGKPFLKKEFEISLQMVNVFYFQALAFLAFPLCPYSPLLVLPMLVANFKFDLWMLRTFKIKPRTPFSAADAGSFFIKFYSITVLLGLAVTHQFLSIDYLPKDCDLQDAHVNLCTANSYDSATQLCTLDTSNAMASSFDEADECAEGYPLCVCARACGPFVYSQDGYEALQGFFEGYSVTGWLYNVFASNTAFVWCVAVAVALAYTLRGNSLGVVVDQHRSEQQALGVRLAGLQRKLEKQQTQLERQKKALAANSV